MTNIDTAIFAAIHDWAGKSQLLDWSGIFWAKYALYLLVAAVFLWSVAFAAVRWRRLEIFFWSLGAAVASRFIFAEIVRMILPRDRPFRVLNFEPLVVTSAFEPSFPSGHAAFLFAFVAALSTFMPKARWLYLAAIAVGIARIFVGVHWPSDILVGAILGIGVGLAVGPVFRRFGKK